jgi:DNA-binding transcriptional LysR family regulator
MPPTDYNDLALLVQVARAGTFAAAARETGIPKSTLSRRILTLEERLKVQLLQRGARRILLTAAGDRLVSHCGPLLAQVEATEAALSRDWAVARGSLRIACPGDYGVHVIAPLVEAFILHYPDISVDVYYHDRVVDLLGERFDVAVRVGPVVDPNLTMRTIGSIGGAVVASPTYVAEHGTPRSPEELRGHAALVFTSPPFGPQWRLSHEDGRVVEVEVQAKLSTNNLAVLHRAARSGLGVARLPDYLYTADCASGHLVRLLPGWTTGLRKVHLVWPQSRQPAMAHRCFLDFVGSRLARP